TSRSGGSSTTSGATSPRREDAALGDRRGPQGGVRAVTAIAERPRLSAREGEPALERAPRRAVCGVRLSRGAALVRIDSRPAVRGGRVAARGGRGAGGRPH